MTENRQRVVIFGNCGFRIFIYRSMPGKKFRVKFHVEIFKKENSKEQEHVNSHVDTKYRVTLCVQHSKTDAPVVAVMVSFESYHDVHLMCIFPPFGSSRTV